MHIRPVEAADAPAIQAIYAPIVATTAISLEDTPPDTAEIASRIGAIIAAYPYLVAEEDGTLAGFAYASQHRTRSGYRYSVDVTVYVAGHAQRRGIGRALYAALLPAARSLGYHAAFAGIALPNPASIALHEAMGFTPVGTYYQAGFKFGRWHDVGWWQRLL